MPLEPVTRTSIASGIVEQIRRRILRGDFAPGERLPSERTLAERLGTNRNTLREAIRTLESQGLVRVRQGDGVRVLDPARHGTLELAAAFVLEARDPAARLQVIVDALRVRTFLAAEAAYRAAEADAQRAADTRRALLEALEAVLAESEPRARAQRDLALFLTLIEAAQRHLLTWACNAIAPACRDLIAKAPELWWFPPDYEASWREIAGAIGEKQPARARSLVVSYFERTDRALEALATAMPASVPPEQPAAAPAPEIAP